MRAIQRLALVIGLLVVALAAAPAASAAPGNGHNAILIFNTCDGVEMTLVSEASGRAPFATAHLLVGNEPAPLVSLAYVMSTEVDGQTVILDSGSYGHAHPERGQDIVACSGYFTVDDPESGLTIRFDIQVTGFFPAGS